MAQTPTWQTDGFVKRISVEGMTDEARLKMSLERRDIHRIRTQGKERMKQWFAERAKPTGGVLDQWGDPI